MSLNNLSVDLGDAGDNAAALRRSERQLNSMPTGVG